MKTDISKTTILILLVFTVIVSVVGTYTVLVSVSAPSAVTMDGETSPHGNVQLAIIEPPGEPIADGEVTLEILQGGK